MAIIVCCSAGGSPGVTTTSLGLALRWSRDVLLADCDRHPNQAVLAGYLRGLPAGGRGLSGLAEAYRAQEIGSVPLLDQTVLLADDLQPQRRFLPGFTHPRAARLFEGYWPRLVDQFAELAAQRTDVIIDWGRLDADGLPAALVRQAEQIVLVTRSDLPALAAARLALPELSAALAQVSARAGLLVVGSGRPYGADEIATQLGLPLLATLPWQPESALVLSAGETQRRFTERALWRGLGGLAMQLAGRSAAADAVAGPRPMAVAQ